MPIPHQMKLDEVEGVVDLIGRIFGFDTQYPRELMVAALRQPKTRRDTLIVADNGKPVTHIRTVFTEVSVYGCEFKVASIGAVATDESYRGRGYAGATLEASLREMKKRGAKILIVSGSRGLYKRAHCATAGRAYEILLSKEQLAPISTNLKVRRVNLEDWPTLAPLHQAETVRFVRPNNLAKRLPFWWNCDSPELWLIEREGRPVAYLGLAISWPRDLSSKRRVTWEYAGSRAAILEALPLIFTESGLEEIFLIGLGHDSELLYLLQQHGWEPQARPLGGTHRLLDVPGLMKNLKPYLAARLTSSELRKLAFAQTDDRVVFAYGDQQCEVSLAEAAPLVLGGPNAPQLEGELGRLLAEVFPIPFPRPGFDYV